MRTPRSAGRVAALLAGAMLLGAGAGPVFAQDGAGTTAGVLLELPPAPRALALGDAYAALAADELALFYNPARLAASAGAVGLAYQRYPFDAGAGSLAAARPFGPGVLGLGMRFLDLGEIEVVEPDPTFWEQRGRPTGARVGGGEIVVGAGYGISAAERVQLGVAATLIRRQIAESAETGAAFDAGAAVELWRRHVVLALAAQNLGAALGPGRAAPLPRTFRAAAAVRVGEGAGPRAAVTVGARARRGRTTLVSGLEAGFTLARDRLAVARIGYDGRFRDEGELAPLVVGGGVRVGRLAVDYAYRTLGPLGAAHQFGVSFHEAR